MSKKELNELVIYELHVRGFTKHPSSGVREGNLCRTEGENPLPEGAGNECSRADAYF